MTNIHTPSLPPIAIIGLGYVGLPLAVAFGSVRPVVGFDIHLQRIAQLQAGHDSTLEVAPAQLQAATQLRFSSDASDLRDCRIFIVTVPTPVDDANHPDLRPLIKASETVGRALKPGDIVIYESTVYPGATEEVCVPVLEQTSGLTYIHSGNEAQIDPAQGFYCGYSPERINPGDKVRRLATIPKVTSGSTPATADFVDALYARIVTAGTHKAPSTKVAEAAKVIENTQRDANIALINEFALIFHRLGIDTHDVLAAAGSKWNFLPFRPGLVGGHCIGVDPYYLSSKAQSTGYYPGVLLACRRIKDAMGAHVAAEVVRLMIRKGMAVAGARVLVLGMTFKENCPDLRNTRVVDIVAALRQDGIAVDVHDPWVDAAEARHEYGLDLVAQPAAGGYDAIIVAVGHEQFRALGAEGIRALGKPACVLFDVKYVLPRTAVDGRL